MAITYALAGGPPDDWYNLQVIDLDSGREITSVIECNAAEDWLERYFTAPDGGLLENPSTGFPVRERLTGRFEIRRKDPSEA